MRVGLENSVMLSVEDETQRRKMGKKANLVDWKGNTFSVGKFGRS